MSRAERRLLAARGVAEARENAARARQARWRRIRRAALALLVAGPLVWFVFDYALGLAVARERARDRQLDLWVLYHVEHSYDLPAAQRGTDPWGMPWLERPHHPGADWGWEPYSSGPNRVDEKGLGDDIDLAYDAVPHERAALQRTDRGLPLVWTVFAAITVLMLVAPAPVARGREVLLTVPLSFLLALLTGGMAVHVRRGLALPFPFPWAGDSAVFTGAMAGVFVAGFVLRLWLGFAARVETEDAPAPGLL